MDSDDAVKSGVKSGVKNDVKNDVKCKQAEQAEQAEQCEQKNRGGRPAYKKDRDPIAMVGRVKLTERQKRFISYYNGNGVEAAKKAGYSQKYARSMATYLLNKCAPVKEALREKSNMIFSSAIADSEELMVRWTRAIRCLDGSPEDTGMMTKEQLRASENLAKARGMFVEVQKVEHKTYVMPCGGQVGEAVMQGSLDIVERLKRVSAAGGEAAEAAEPDDGE